MAAGISYCLAKLYDFVGLTLAVCQMHTLCHSLTVHAQQDSGGNKTAPLMWFSMGCGVDIRSIMVLHGLQKNSLFHYGLLHWLQ